MPHDTPPIPADRHRLLAAADRLAPMLAAAAPDIERARRLPQPVADALADEGLYSMLVPRSLGGSDTDVHTFVQVIERLARAESASAWCAFIANTTALIAGYLPPQAAGEIFARRGVKLAGVYAPHGRAKPAEQDGVPGFIVSGTWPWGSGTANADWILGGCLVAGEEGVRSMVFEASQVTLAGDWTAMGLCGTGSGRFSVTEAFVPRARSASILADTPLAQPLYQFPIFCLLAVGIAAVSLGIARQAIDSLVTLSNQKMPEGSRRVLAERASTQQHVARAEAGLRSARSFLLDAVDAAWRAALANELPVDLRRDMRLATTHAVEVSAGVVQAMYSCAGGNAIFESSPLQRCLRDVQVASQHTMVGESTWELTGRLYLGLPTQVAML